MNSGNWTSSFTLERPHKLWRDVSAYTSDMLTPTLRLGVTGLARSGKTVFITSLIHNLIHHGRLPFFAAQAEGRLHRAYLEPQPDDAVPRFDYERHIAAFTHHAPFWPDSTRQISQLRLTLDYQPSHFMKRMFGRDKLSIDIVDYPGEWLLDLPLLALSFDAWSRQSIDLASQAARAPLARDWLHYLSQILASGDDDEQKIRKASALFTDYLRRCREEKVSLSMTPPGRFLMPGDLEGSPALTFSPLLPAQDTDQDDSLRALMARRFEAYKTHVVKPFFKDHFAKLDRQIVLIDVLQALNAGPQALSDMGQAISDILHCFRPGENSWLSSILGPRIDRILFAATKADHLHHKSHDRLEAIVGALVESARERASFAGADVKIAALAALRSTREAEASKEGEKLPCILGYPLAGEKLSERVFDGSEELAIFPGDLPQDPAMALRSGLKPGSSEDEALRFIRFRPPKLETVSGGHAEVPLPHIRLDRAIEFLIGDKLI